MRHHFHPFFELGRRELCSSGVRDLVRTICLKNRDDVEREMGLLGVDPGGRALMSDKALFKVVKIYGVSSPAANILKQEMLSLGGDAGVAKGVINCKIEKSDVLLMGTLKQLNELAKKLKAQPFGLKKVALDLSEHLKRQERGNKLQIRLRDRSLCLSSRTHIMGILNVTPDSFSDGGRFIEKDAALGQALRMIAEGADIIDIGGESTRPGSDTVPFDVEVERVVPTVEAIRRKSDIPISVDTYKPTVARCALDVGADIINDISALREMEKDVAAKPDSLGQKMIAVATEYEAPVVLMHLLGTPKTMQKNPSYVDLMGEIWEFLQERISMCRQMGIGEGKIIVDPGIGFGKTPEHNLEIIRRLSELASLGCPLLVGPSRKSFIGKTLDLSPEDRLEGTVAACVIAACNGANVLRVHDVKETVRVLSMADAISSGSFDL